MATARLQVNFNDSSDDGNSHMAVLDIVPDGDNAGEDNSNSMRSHARDDASASSRAGTGKRDGKEKGGGGGWFSNFVMRGVKGLVGGSGESSHEPFQTERRASSREGHSSSSGRSSSSTSANGNWGYGVHDRDPYSTSTHSSSSGSSSDGSLSSAARAHQLHAEPENFQINLRESVLQYLRTPEELYLNIILATLKTGTTQVTADVFHAAAGCPLLIKTFVDSGYADLEDPEVQSILQQELDMVLSGDPYNNDILYADQADYLRCLCNVKSLRINQRQVVLMRYSGFEFIKMLFDCPHLRESIETPKKWAYVGFRIIRVINVIASWIGVFNSLLFTAAVIWTAVTWFETPGQKNNGYWTVIGYGLGYVLMLVAVLRTEQGKVRQYEDQVWSFPDNNLIIIPVIPLYQIMLVITALRYELIADKRRYFIIRYDLRNSIGIHLIAHGLCHAIPQVIVQVFLFTEQETASKETGDKICFWLLVGSACASFFMSVFDYMRMVIFAHSCNTFGFAVMFVDSDDPSVEQRIKPSDMATRTLIFATMALMIAMAVTLFIFLLNISNCSAGAKVFLSVSFGVTGLSVVAMSLVFVYANFSRLFGIFCVPALLCMIAYFPFTKANSQAESPVAIARLCSLFVYHYSTWIVPLFATFGFVCVTFLVWLGMVLYEVITGERVQQQLVDNYIYLL